MWDQSNDINQAGSVDTPQQSGNYLSPQQRYMMGQYANSLMAPQQSRGIGSGLANMGKSFIGGYLENQAYPHPSSQSNPRSSQMQLNSAGGSPIQSLFSGLFGGSPSTS
jgi:hypothetical protein